jgi:hypothetical protein
LKDVVGESRAVFHKKISLQIFCSLMCVIRGFQAPGYLMISYFGWLLYAYNDAYGVGINRRGRHCFGVFLLASSNEFA